MINIILSLGTNLGNKSDNMNAMVKMVSEILLPPIVLSKLMETEPIGIKDTQEWYYNRILSGNYNVSIKKMLYLCEGIEKSLGRINKGDRTARTADIDILLADDRIINEDNLIIPHPQLLNRRFCIEGIVSIDPDRIHPINKRTFKEIYQQIHKDVLDQKINFISD